MRSSNPIASKAILLIALLFFATPHLFAQCQNCGGPPAVDVLGAHNDGGRGCIGCHIPRRNETGMEPGFGALWGVNAPDYTRSVGLGDGGNSVEVPSSQLTTTDTEISGIILCLSCHDGHVTPQNMMAGQSYESRIGLLRGAGAHTLPTFLGAELTQRYADHPLGQSAIIPVGYGLTFTNGKFSVMPGSPYAQFVAHYGWPTLAPLQRSNPYGIDRYGQPYLLCTTCHNQHAMNVYVSTPSNPIAQDGGGQQYSTFFFVNGPYNRNAIAGDAHSSSSNAQFCRQCHFNLSNEANNANTVTTNF